MFCAAGASAGTCSGRFWRSIGIIGGVERKIHFFAFDLPHSDACFVVGYPAETTEAFCDGHVRAFSFFGGVPQSILYDNTKIAVAAFSAMEGGDGRAFSPSCNRIPIPGSFRSAWQRQRQRQSRGAGRLCPTELPCPHSGFRELRGVERLPCGMLPRSDGGPVARPRQDDRPKIGARSGRVPETTPAAVRRLRQDSNEGSSLSLVRYRLNDYSVPTKYGHRDVLVRGYVHDVVISCGAEVIARHPRSYERNDFLFDPLHYLR